MKAVHSLPMQPIAAGPNLGGTILVLNASLTKKLVLKDAPMLLKTLRACLIKHTYLHNRIIILLSFSHEFTKQKTVIKESHSPKF